MSALHASRSVLQHLLSKRVILKYTPHLHFKLDESIERGTRVINILEQIEIPPDEPEQPEAPDSSPDPHHE
jgi:ribosome-binding factor A